MGENEWYVYHIARALGALMEANSISATALCFRVFKIQL